MKPNARRASKAVVVMLPRCAPLASLVFAVLALCPIAARAQQQQQRQAPPQPQPPAALGVPNSRPAAMARLDGLTATERATLAPFLAQGPIALVEFSEGDGLPAIVVAAEVSAPADVVLSVISDPVHYPRFMPALDRVTMRGRRGNTLSYEWQWRTAIFTMRGTNVMTIYRAPRDRQALGHRVAINSTNGDLGTGRFTWRVHPLAPCRSLVVLAMRLDVRNANYIARELSAAARSINRSINVSLCHVMVLATRREAERRAGVRPRAPAARPAPPAHELVRPQIELEQLGPILARGDLLLMKMDGDRLSQVTVLGRMGAGADRVRPVMVDPRSFGSALMPGSQAIIAGRDGGGVLFDWDIDVPLVGSSGRMRLRDDGTRVSVEAVSGALRGGRWRFETPAFPWGEVVVIGWGMFDPGDTTWLLRSIVDANPYFGYGLAAASQLMVARAIRTRVWP